METLLMEVTMEPQENVEPVDATEIGSYGGNTMIMDTREIIGIVVFLGVCVILLILANIKPKPVKKHRRQDYGR